MLKDTLRAAAIKLLTDYGDTGTLRQTTIGSYDPNTGERNNTIVDSSIKYLREEVEVIPNQNKGNALGFTSKITIQTDKALTTADVIITNGSKQNITSINPISTQDKIIIYELLCKGPL